MYIVEDTDYLITSEFISGYHSIDGLYMTLYGFLSYSSDIDFSCFEYKYKYNKQFPSHGSYVTLRFRKKIEDFLRRLFE